MGRGKMNVGSDNGLTPSRGQANICYKYNIVFWLNTSGPFNNAGFDLRKNITHANMISYKESKSVQITDSNTGPVFCM